MRVPQLNLECLSIQTKKKEKHYTLQWYNGLDIQRYVWWIHVLVWMCHFLDVSSLIRLPENTKTLLQVSSCLWKIHTTWWSQYTSRLTSVHPIRKKNIFSQLTLAALIRSIFLGTNENGLKWFTVCTVNNPVQKRLSSFSILFVLNDQ